MPELVRIAVVGGLTSGFGREVLRGVYAHARNLQYWQVAAFSAPPRRSFAGFIAQIATRNLAAEFRRRKRPVVNFSTNLERLPYPTVGLDNPAVGRMAAGYFLGRGFRNFGCFGHARSMVSRGRGEGFRAGLAEAGQRCRFFLEDCPEADLGKEERYEAGIERWLRGLAKPAAVFAPSDFSSRQLARACRRRGLRVPEEVALLGVDNDDLLCYAAHVPLSSIAVPGERIGRLAAAWLEGMLEGRRPPVAPVLFPPLEVVTRASTDLLAEPDEVVRAALAAMRAPAQPAQSVKELLGVVPASRCTLERRFRAALGRPPGEELRRLRLEKAKELLGGTELSLSEVAGGAGYGSAQWLCAVFRRRVGMTPGRYRAWFRSGKNNGG